MADPTVRKRKSLQTITHKSSNEDNIHQSTSNRYQESNQPTTPRSNPSYPTSLRRKPPKDIPVSPASSSTFGNTDSTYSFSPPVEKEYQSLEELLSQAGYKDVRVFTPEAERLRAMSRNGGQGRDFSGRRSFEGSPGKISPRRSYEKLGSRNAAGKERNIDIPTDSRKTNREEEPIKPLSPTQWLAQFEHQQGYPTSSSSAQPMRKSHSTPIEETPKSPPSEASSWWTLGWANNHTNQSAKPTSATDALYSALERSAGQAHPPSLPTSPEKILRRMKSEFDIPDRVPQEEGSAYTSSTGPSEVGGGTRTTWGSPVKRKRKVLNRVVISQEAVQLPTTAEAVLAEVEAEEEQPIEQHIDSPTKDSEHYRSDSVGSISEMAEVESGLSDSDVLDDEDEDLPTPTQENFNDQLTDPSRFAGPSQTELDAQAFLDGPHGDYGHEQQQYDDGYDDQYADQGYEEGDEGFDQLDYEAAGSQGDEYSDYASASDDEDDYGTVIATTQMTPPPATFPTLPTPPPMRAHTILQDLPPTPPRIQMERLITPPHPSAATTYRPSIIPGSAAEEACVKNLRHAASVPAFMHREREEGRDGGWFDTIGRAWAGVAGAEGGVGNGGGGGKVMGTTTRLRSGTVTSAPPKALISLIKPARVPASPRLVKGAPILCDSNVAEDMPPISDFSIFTSTSPPKSTPAPVAQGWTGLRTLRSVLSLGSLRARQRMEVPKEESDDTKPVLSPRLQCNSRDDWGASTSGFNAFYNDGTLKKVGAFKYGNTTDQPAFRDTGVEMPGYMTEEPDFTQSFFYQPPTPPRAGSSKDSSGSDSPPSGKQAKRQQSIKSLRAHLLKKTVQRPPIPSGLIPPVPALPFHGRSTPRNINAPLPPPVLAISSPGAIAAGLPPRELVLEGEEWEGGSYASHSKGLKGKKPKRKKSLTRARGGSGGR